MKRLAFRKYLAFSLALVGMSLLAGCTILSEVLEKESPVIEAFEATPDRVTASSEVLFSWEVSDADTDELTCTLTFGDGESEHVADCAQVTNTFYTYEEVGNYVVKFEVTDGSNPVSRTIPVVVSEAEPEEPEAPEGDLAIQTFVAQPETGQAPLLSIFRWIIIGDAVTCTLTYDDGETETVENCQEVTDTFHTFEDPGGYRVVLEADDGESKVKKSLIVVVSEPE